jgi:precorrin-2/cobalt-factor-2 C20-methyltransferase
MALDIAAQSIDVGEKEILYLDFSMSPDAAVRNVNHEGLSKQLMNALDSGNDVAMLNIGDPLLFGTFSYMAEIVQTHGYEIEAVAGVPSFCACAAALGQSLTTMRQPLHIFPASYSELESGLTLPGGKVVMKSAHALADVLTLIEKNGISGHAAAVCDCGLPSQRVCRDVSEAGSESYFTTILIRP